MSQEGAWSIGDHLIFLSTIVFASHFARRPALKSLGISCLLVISDDADGDADVVDDDAVGEEMQDVPGRIKPTCLARL
eukprot:430763-Amphidinium_carterae.1